jgi:hypothetical protein
MPPGDVSEHPIDAAFKAANRVGGKGTVGGMAAYIDTLMTAAERGDRRVTRNRTPDWETNATWVQEAKERLVRARDHQRRERL